MNEYPYREYWNRNVTIVDNKNVEADLSWTYCGKMWRLPQKNYTKNSITKKKKRQFLVDVLERQFRNLANVNLSDSTTMGPLTNKYLRI